ncbi:glideosome-associated protein 40, putative (GAP40) [Plasmodium ovale curtisi]|uniref:Glideosome-associated protein 40, putative (GAP40) n=1 Tax=Plasmodium ovale curtisi TaxID=864141 RepID=A0A1A8VZY9_PLAOA|nr:glideosome-associated protein 40, putative (GAP40) [Plasmodium ovale curtisi]SBS92771.1 glideosome-associated protein 40, putative (GAP40) [Plasmodium ovale curtisi]
MEKLNLPEWTDIERYFKDPELITAEVLFVGLTLCNVFVMYRLFLDVIPFPIFVTWWQLAQGLLVAYVCGELGKEFPKFAYFPKVEINENMLKVLFIPSIFYCLMLVLSNYLLYKTPCIASYPVLVSFTVVFHHLTRFVGCGEEYMPLRWKSIVFLLAAFVLGCFDSKTTGKGVIVWALLYALFSAIFRAGFMQKIMHLVDGKGNTLHNNQHLLGVIMLPVLILISGEWNVFLHMPYNVTSLHTWQMWGCLVTVGTLPFIKNVISNRLVRRTGQGPWRFLEIISIVLVFFIGMSYNTPSFMGYLAIICVIIGRSLGAFDVLLNASDYMLAEDERKRKTSRSNYAKSRQGTQASKPFLSPGENDEDDESSFSSNDSKSYQGSQDYDDKESVNSSSQHYSVNKGTSRMDSSSNHTSHGGMSADESRMGSERKSNGRMSSFKSKSKLSRNYSSKQQELVDSQA